MITFTLTSRKVEGGGGGGLKGPATLNEKSLKFVLLAAQR